MTFIFLINVVLLQVCPLPPPPTDQKLSSILSEIWLILWTVDPSSTPPQIDTNSGPTAPTGPALVHTYLYNYIHIHWLPVIYVYCTVTHRCHAYVHTYMLIYSAYIRQSCVWNMCKMSCIRERAGMWIAACVHLTTFKVLPPGPTCHVCCHAM